MSDLPTRLVAAFTIVMGCGIVVMWTVDMVRSPKMDRSRGLASAHDRSTGTLLLPHWLAEYATAARLIAGGLRLLLRWQVGGRTCGCLATCRGG